MTGVTLSYTTGNKRLRTHDIYLKRSYANNNDTKQPIGPKMPANLGFTPSPVLTSANTEETVPPIVPIR